MAEIYEVEHISRHEIAALKLLRAKFASSDMAIQRGHLEAIAGTRAQHPNLNAVLGAGEYGGRPYLVTPLLKGLNLRGWLNEIAPLSIPDALIIAIEVTAAVAALHQQARAVHRDIKPENIFLTLEGGVKLLDLGVAKLLETTGFQLRTASGEYAGSLAYMAPEQLESRASFASDLYSIGLVLYEMIAGRHPLVDVHGRWPSSTALLQRFFHYEVPPSLSQVAPDCPESLSRIVDQCLAQWPAHRPTSADALLTLLTRELERWRASHPSATPERGLVFQSQAPAVAHVLAVRSRSAPHSPAAATSPSHKVILQLDPLALAPTNPTRGTLRRRARRKYFLWASIAFAIFVAVYAVTRSPQSYAPRAPSGGGP
jgi:serine/threonine-protein kinase